MRSSYLTAAVIAVLIMAWLATGQLGEGTASHPSPAERNLQAEAQRIDRPPTAVRGRIIEAEPKRNTVTLRGRTQNKRSVTVRSETTGRVVERPVERGTRVQEGDLLCRLSVDEREAQLREAREHLHQARVNHEGSRRLAEQGLQSESAIAATRARLAAAQAQLARRELELERTEIRAPFAGIVDEVGLELGDFVQPGGACATLLDLDPMLLVGHVSEREVNRIEPGSEAEATLIDGSEARGRVSFIGSRSDTATRTYPVEIRVDNPDYRLRSGVTAEIRIPLETIEAHRVSSALLALDDTGRIGVRTVDPDQRVAFNRVEIIDDEGGALWVTGLPEIATLITVGQELVTPGELVRVNLEEELLPRAGADGARAAPPEP